MRTILIDSSLQSLEDVERREDGNIDFSAFTKFLVSRTFSLSFGDLTNARLNIRLKEGKIVYQLIKYEVPSEEWQKIKFVSFAFYLYRFIFETTMKTYSSNALFSSFLYSLS